jgi:hypothetical protein
MGYPCHAATQHSLWPLGEYMPLLDEDQIRAQLTESLRQHMAGADMASFPSHIVFGIPVDTVVNTANKDAMF